MKRVHWGFFCNSIKFQFGQDGTAWGGFRISEKGVHMYKGVGVRFADFISFS